MLERLQKIIAQAGVASRREAETLITDGKVTVNGELITELGAKADPAKDHIKVNGKRIHVDETQVYILLNKPKGVVSTVHDPEGRPTVTDIMREVKNRIYPVGRLDFNTEGVLLLTNDGNLTHQLLAPKSKCPKTYMVKVHGQLDKKTIMRLQRGITVDGTRYGSCEVELLKSGQNSWFRVVLFEGKNHQIKKMFEAVGHPVSKLRRIAFAFLTSKGLRPGEWRYLSPVEVERLKRGDYKFLTPLNPFKYLRDVGVGLKLSDYEAYRKEKGIPEPKRGPGKPPLKSRSSRSGDFKEDRSKGEFRSGKRSDRAGGEDRRRSRDDRDSENRSRRTNSSDRWEKNDRRSDGRRDGRYDGPRSRGGEGRSERRYEGQRSRDGEGRSDRRYEGQRSRGGEGRSDRRYEGQRSRGGEGRSDRRYEGQRSRGGEGRSERRYEGQRSRGGEGRSDRRYEGQRSRDGEGRSDRRYEGQRSRDGEGRSERRYEGQRSRGGEGRSERRYDGQRSRGGEERSERRHDSRRSRDREDRFDKDRSYRPRNEQGERRQRSDENGGRSRGRRNESQSSDDRRRGEGRGFRSKNRQDGERSGKPTRFKARKPQKAWSKSVDRSGKKGSK